MRTILFLSSALVLSACSLTGEQEFYDSPPSYHQSGSYSYSCGASSCAPGQSYSVAANKPSGHYGHSYGANHHAPQQPSAHAYGSQVQHHQAHRGHPPQLRGMHNPHARQGYKYGTLGAVMYDTNSDIYGVQGRLGYQSANYWGAEVEGSVGLIDDSETAGGLDFEAGVDYSVGAFALARLPVGERLSLFGRGGYHATRIDGSVDDGTTEIEFSDTVDGFAYGGGAELALNPRDSLRLDYTHYEYGGGNGSADSVAVAYSRKF